MDCLHADRPLTRVETDDLSDVMTADFAAARPSWSAAAAWSTGAAAVGLFCIVLMALLGGGCAGRPTLWPNDDPALRKTSAEFAADAARRHPYKAEAPRGGPAEGRASADYGLDLIQVVNLTNEDWDNVEIWVNKNYVVAVPKLEKGAPRVKTLNFTMLYDAHGHTFPTSNTEPANQVHTVEMLRDGKMYDLKVQLAD